MTDAIELEQRLVELCNERFGKYLQASRQPGFVVTDTAQIVGRFPDSQLMVRVQWRNGSEVRQLGLTSSVWHTDRHWGLIDEEGLQVASTETEVLIDRETDVAYVLFLGIWEAARYHFFNREQGTHYIQRETEGATAREWLHFPLVLDGES